MFIGCLNVDHFNVSNFHYAGLLLEDVIITEGHPLMWSVVGTGEVHQLVATVAIDVEVVGAGMLFTLHPTFLFFSSRNRTVNYVSYFWLNVCFSQAS